ncbi:MAG: ABC transporter substrate-binding protein [Methylobacterium sp.]|jgi:branched-chain amino acid transport system substrate-binding protein|nr:ABC transporter substrate-binding protein [Methylobacterium sp.]MCA3619860.1 ABC transporter substrate-binding protein [Methylobacterium sp.]
MRTGFLRKLALRGGLASAALTAISVTAIPAAAQPAQPCIGASWELTGALAHMGRQIRYGVETALAEINGAGGVLGQQLRLRVYDDGGEPPRAVDNAMRIGEQDNCIVMIGGARTPSAIALRQPLHDMGLPWIGVVSAGVRVLDHEGRANKWMFRVGLNDGLVAPFLVDNALKLSPTRKVAFMHEASAWGQGAAPFVQNAAKNAGLTFVAAETFNVGDTDMTAQLIRLRTAGAESIVYYGLDAETDALLRSMERLNYRPTVVSALGIGAQLSSTAGPLANGVRVMGTFSFWGKLEPNAQRVLNTIMANNREITGPKDLLLHSGTASAYDVTNIIARAITLAGSFDRAKLRDALYKVEFRGLITHYNPAFSPQNHDALRSEMYRLFVFHDGMVIPVEDSPYAAKK